MVRKCPKCKSEDIVIYGTAGYDFVCLKCSQRFND